MKRISLIIISAFMTLGICQQTQAAATAAANAKAFDNTDALKYRRTESTQELIGTEVWNLQGEKLGKVKYITADLQNARLVEVVVTSGGGLFGIGAIKTAVAPRALSLDAAGQVLRLNMSKAQFAAAPRYDVSHMEAATARERVAEVNRFYGLKPWFFLEGQRVYENAEILRLGHIQRLDRILMLPITSVQGGYLGKVGTVVMDIPKGQIVHLVAVVTKMGGNNSMIIQPRSLTYNTAGSALVMDENYNDLAGEPNFKWLNATSFQQESYVNREVQANRGRHSQQNANAGIVSGVRVMEQGEAFRDREKTAFIKQSIQADRGLSANAKNVEVVTLHSQITLRGHVNTVEDKRRIGEIAAKAGRPENVSNLLEVRPLRR